MTSGSHQRPERVAPRIDRAPSTADAVHSLLRQAGLRRLASETEGCPTVRIALLDGTVDTLHPLLREAAIEQTAGAVPREGADDRRHATLVASVLVGRRDPAVGLCPRCTLLSIPVVDHAFASGRLSAAAAALRVAAGIREAIRQSADVLQLSLAFDPEQGRSCAPVLSALAAAAARGIVPVVAAGNAAHLAPNPILRAPGVVGVVAADEGGSPLDAGVLGPTVGRFGLRAPGLGIPGAVPPAATGWGAGSSIAACFVTGTFALLRCCFPSRSPAEIVAALLCPRPGPAAVRSIVPPRLDGDASAALLRRNPFPARGPT